MRNSKRNLIAGIINKIVSMMFPFIIRTIMIKMIGVEYLGLNSLFTSVLSMLSITELGFGAAMVYNMYKPIAENDTETVCALLNAYKKIYRIVGFVILSLGLMIMPFIKYFISGSYPADINIYVLYLVFLLNSVISYFVFSYKGSLLSATQREDINSNVMTIVNIGMYVIQILMLVIFRKYMAYIIIMPIATIMINIIKSFVVDKVYPDYRCHGTVAKEQMKAIYKNVGALVGHKISGTIILSADNLVISSVLGLTAVAVYNNYYYIVNVLVSFFMIIFNSLRPSVGNSIVKENVDKNYNDFKKITTMIFWLAGWCGICLICLFQPFIEIWVGKDYLLPMSTVIMLGVYFFEWKMLDVMVLYRDAAGMWWSDRFRPYIVATLNLVGNITLVNIWGLNGVVLSTFFTSCFISLPWVMRILFKEYFVGKIREYVGYFLKRAAVVIVVGIITFFATKYIFPNTVNILTFIVKSLVCTILPNILLACVFLRDKGVKEMIVKLIKR